MSTEQEPKLDQPKKPNPSIIKFFEYLHLPPDLQDTSRLFSILASSLITSIEPGPERTVALRKLLEAKDAAVRAKLHPGH